MCNALCRLTLVLCLLLPAAPARATEEYAVATGRACADCHRAAEGGGELTGSGEDYLLEAAAHGSHAPATAAGKWLRFGLGYLHLFFATFWFGTILYVHLILKPAYAVRGLPSGEKLVGIVSFFVVGATGGALTWFRFDTWSALFATRFGQILLVKVVFYLLMLASAIFVIRVLGPRLKGGDAQERCGDEPFTAATLQRCDGQEGRPAYFAWQGRVYDASVSRLWPGGQHMKRHAVGTDLTEALPMAPHDAAVLDRLPVVGTYDPVATVKNPAARVFYLLAYMNLGFVFAILLLVSLWRWG